LEGLRELLDTAAEREHLDPQAVGEVGRVVVLVERLRFAQEGEGTVELAGAREGMGDIGPVGAALVALAADPQVRRHLPPRGPPRRRTAGARGGGPRAAPPAPRPSAAGAARARAAPPRPRPATGSRPRAATATTRVGCRSSCAGARTRARTRGP